MCSLSFIKSLAENLKQVIARLDLVEKENTILKDKLEAAYPINASTQPPTAQSTT